MLLAAFVPASLTVRSAAHLVNAAARRCLLVQRSRSSLTSSKQRLNSTANIQPARLSGILVGASSAVPSAAGAAEAAQPRHGMVTAATPPADDFKSDGAWRQLGAPAEEVQLRFTLPTGQSFRWRATGADEYTGVINQRVFKLRQEADDVSYAVLARGEGAHPAGDAEALMDYFNLGTRLGPLAAGWAAADQRFRDVQPYIPGARVLRQDPLECAFEFICSSNNHISRIHGMVETLCRTYGTRLHATHPAAGEDATPGLEFYAFPTLQQLGEATEAHLRASGFGYRAKFITGSVAQLAAKPGGGSAWLLGLRDVPYPEAAAALCTLPGIGPKVAACVCLFSLDKAGAIPVDTHVWQLACRYYAPHLRNKTLNKQVMEAVETAFVERFGPYAGWAHNTLFIAELASQQEHLPEQLRAGGSRKPARKRKQTSVEAAAAAAAGAATPAAADTATAAAVLEEAAAGARMETVQADAAAAAAAEQPRTPARGAGGSVSRVKLEHTAVTVQDSSSVILGAGESATAVSVDTKSSGSVAVVAAKAATPVAKQQEQQQQQQQVEEGPNTAAPDTPAQQPAGRRSRTRQVARRNP